MIRAGLAAWVLACAFLSGCKDEGAVTACSIDSVASGDTMGSSFVDCGTFTTGSELYTDAAMVSAQACVLNAIRRKQGFQLIYDANGEDGKPTPALSSAYTGTPREGELVLRNYAGEGPADEPEMMSFVSSRTCVMLDVTDSCRPRVGVPCLKCDSVDPGTIVCRG